MDAFPNAAWIDPVTNKQVAFKDLNQSAQRQALAGMGFVNEPPMQTTKRLMLRLYARQAQACLENKINDQKDLDRATSRLRKRLRQTAMSMGLSPSAVNVELDEWYDN